MNNLATQHLKKRHRAERRFQWYGRGTIICVVGILVALLAGIIIKGYQGFIKTEIALTLTYDPDLIIYDQTAPRSSLRQSDFPGLVLASLKRQLPPLKDDITDQEILALVSTGTYADLFNQLLKQPSLIGTRQTLWILASDEVDSFIKSPKLRTLPSSQRQLSDNQIEVLDQLELRQTFNGGFFTRGDSPDPERAGIWGAAMGSLYILLITLLMAFPLGIATAIYLEEFAPKNRLTQFIELNISNLAAVPSIIFGLLGLAIFINVMHLPRSSTLVGGMTLALMTMPTMIVAARAAIMSVPYSIREGAKGLGASPVQIVFHHVLPLAMPGILTGTILSMARALGESAPLLMIGMVAFITDVPRSPLDPATVLPVQIFNWARNPEQGFVETTAAAIIILLIFLGIMNTAAIILRKRFEQKW